MFAIGRENASGWARVLVSRGAEAAAVFARRDGRLELVSEHPPDASSALAGYRAGPAPDPEPTTIDGGWTLVPLTSDGASAGLVAVKGGALDVSQLVLLGAYMAPVLWSQELARRSEHHAERMRHVLSLARAVSSATGLRDLLLACSRGLMDALPFDEAYLLLEEGEAFRVFAIVPRMDGETPSELVWSDAPLTRQVLDAGEPLYIPDMADPETAKRYAARIYDPDPDEPQPMRAYMAAPIRAEPVSGVISVQSSRANAYSEADLQQLATLAELVGVALKRARWEEREAMLQRIARLGRHTQSGDFVGPLLEAARTAWTCTQGAVWEREGDAWRCSTSTDGGASLTVLAELLDEVIESDEPRSFNTYEEMPAHVRDVLAAQDCPTALFVPLRSSSFTGVVMLGGGAGFTQWDREQARFMARELMPYLENLALYRKLEQEAIRDPLTGAFNRRYFMLKAAEAISSAKRYEQTLGFLIVDLQRFSDVNNSYGHQTGDRVLVRVAERFQASLRQSDLFFRIGGDEFVLLLPHATRKSARTAARRCAAALTADAELGRYKVAANIGVAIYPEDGRDIDALLEIGDERMYAAKAARRAVYDTRRPPRGPDA